MRVVFWNLENVTGVISVVSSLWRIRFTFRETLLSITKCGKFDFTANK